MTSGAQLIETNETLKIGWLPLALTDLLFKFIAIVVLTPLLGLVVRGVLLIGGQAVLSDMEIAYFFTRPYGWVCAVMAGAVWLGILALEQAALLAILASAAKGKQLSVFYSLRFAAKNAVAILRVSWRIIASGLALIAPFVLAGAAAYNGLLSVHDINYYIQERPQEFQIAVGAGAILLSVFGFAAVRLCTGWLLALPLVLFDKISPRAALRESSRLMKGRRLHACFWIGVWVALSFLAQSAATMATGALGKWLLLKQSASLTLLAEQVGVILLAGFAVSVAINVVYTLGFSVLLFRGYRKWNPGAESAMEKANLTGANEFYEWPALTRTRISIAGVLGAILAALVGYSALRATPHDDHAKVMARRGASKAAPENTIAAIEAAIDTRADWVEVDVQETADGEIVVMHDSDLMKLATNELKIWNATAKDLKSIDIGSWFHSRFADQRVPTLDEVLKLCKGKIGVIIELKYYGHGQKLEERVAEIVDRHQLSRQVMVMSLKPAGVRKMKALRPQWKCGVLMSIAIGNLSHIEADFFAVNSKFATRDFVAKSHGLGKQVYVWTIDDPATMSMMMNRGVDGILTNRPEAARQVLAQRVDMTFSERVLTEIGALILNAPQSDNQ